ncbi:uncharacterized protein N7484_001053 [Penicillium longicatenatum]|uniref:uncharacterized protein n=1 Tax=Penicillium longicatenatum TaxID=1561947 RepID=UPI0025474BCC|nr:uncharacterized protein N7484_001053 [Penicillium longicatenatum]KAJ5657404.1 hypothetical protein N7484_001053 [Penicillium longicatenatum]
MAYQFFAKSKSRTSSSSPSPHRPARPNKPPIHPPPLQPPAVAKSGPPNVSPDTFPPYPHEIPTGYATGHPYITVETVKTVHIPSLTRITTTLLPIRYPTSFYTSTITDPVIASLSRVAIYHDHPVAAGPSPGSLPGTDQVIGGIRCRLEKQDPGQVIHGREATNLYIQTLHLLSAHRGRGVATSLLNSLLFTPTGDGSSNQVSELVKHYNISSVTAHVHEANEDALRWYVSRGFKVQDGIVEGYYRRLKPSGAKIVRLEVQWEDEKAEGKPQVSLELNEAAESSSPNDADDEDWEKVEAEDSDEGDHGVQLLSESRILDSDDTPSRKRKAEEEKGNHPQRR